MLHRIFLFFVGLFVANTSLLAQSQEGINFSINLLSSSSVCDSLTVSLTLTNIGQDDLLIYKPNKEEICSYFMEFQIINAATDSMYEWRPCHDGTKIDLITLVLQNAILLEKGDSYTKNFTINFQDVTYNLKLKPAKGKYKLRVLIDDSWQNFRSDCKKKIFQGGLISNFIYFTIL